MIKSAVTVCLVPSLAGGPWIYWDDIETSISKAKKAGFDAIELFTPSADALDPNTLKNLLTNNHMELAAAGSGAGRVFHQLTLTSPDVNIRKKALGFVTGMIDFAGPLNAPVIIGSMQGQISDGTTREQTYEWLAASLVELASRAAKYNVTLILEPLNRYETNLLNTLEQGTELIDSLGTKNIVLLADLFHMNIEAESIASSLRQVKNYIGYVHFADSNRRPVGSGHTDMKEVAETLKEIGYDGYVSAEALAYPDPDAAARQTMQSFNHYFR
jgi:sugar phosphate isomerase/epimerase